MKDLNELIGKIDRLLSQWTSVRDNNNIGQMLKMQEDLSIYSYYLAGLVADMNLYHNTSYIARKFQQAKNKNLKRAEGLNVSDSESQSEQMLKDIREEEINNLHSYDMAKLKLTQINKMLSSMQQTISFKKSEYEKEFRTRPSA